MTIAVIDRPVTTGGEETILTAIEAPDAALAIWTRRLAPLFQAILATLDLDRLDDVVIDLDAGTPIHAALADAGYPDDAAALLAADIDRLVHCQSRLTGVQRLTVKLEVIETDACRRFHADYVTLRLLCTYIGPATQWRHADAPETIHALATGEVGLFKGRRLLDPPPILHRSPPILATGGRRLLLVIDPARSPDDL